MLSYVKCIRYKGLEKQSLARIRNTNNKNKREYSGFILYNIKYYIKIIH